MVLLMYINVLPGHLRFKIIFWHSPSIIMWNRLLSLFLSILSVSRIAFAAIIQPRETALDKVTLAELEQSVCRDLQRYLFQSRYKFLRKMEMCCNPNMVGKTLRENNKLTDCIQCK